MREIIEKKIEQLKQGAEQLNNNLIATRGGIQALEMLLQDLPPAPDAAVEEPPSPDKQEG